DEKIVAITHVVVYRRGSDAEISSETTNGQLLPSFLIDEARCAGENFCSRRDRGSAATRRFGLRGSLVLTQGVTSFMLGLVMRANSPHILSSPYNSRDNNSRCGRQCGQ